jgi:hypothetical protein
MPKPMQYSRTEGCVSADRINAICVNLFTQESFGGVYG